MGDNIQSDESSRVPPMHPLEQHLLDTFHLDRLTLHRLALFMLAHTLIDRHLILTVGLDVMRKQGGVDKLTDAEADAVIDAVAEGTFGCHLQKANNGGLLPDQAQRTAREMNKARNGFLHWKRKRFSIPHYNGHDITSDIGFERCMTDSLKFLAEVPFGETLPNE